MMGIILNYTDYATDYVIVSLSILYRFVVKSIYLN